MKNYFKFNELNTNYKTETIAGLTTFVTISYIVIVNPAILENAGIPKDAAMIATILTAIFGTLFVGLYANKPFAVAPYIGTNVFVAYTVVGQLGYSWQTALGGIFIGGVFYVIISFLKIRTWLSESIPLSVKSSISVGLGLFIAFIGLLDTGLIVSGSNTHPVQFGDLSQIEVQISLFTLIITGLLFMKKIPGSLLIGIIVSSLIGYSLGVSEPPHEYISLPPSISDTLWQLDIRGALTVGFLSVIFTLFIFDFIGTLAAIISLSLCCNLCDKEGNMKDSHKPMLADSMATVVGAVLGTTTSGIFIESATGIKAGGRTGFTAVIIALGFLLALFFTHVVTAIPAYAYAPILVIIGATMLSPVKNIDFSDMSDLMPNAIIIFFMVFTLDLGIGITLGLILYPLFKIIAGKTKEINPGMWLFFVLSILFYILKP
jgi:AGZA family xanthine/uracil permease-like MFS transporter